MAHGEGREVSNDPKADDLVKRHRVSTRIWHWLNVVSVFIMLMSGLAIFNAHPRLYWGSYGANQDVPWLQIDDDNGRGYLQIGDVQVTTTGILGVSSNGEGGVSTNAFPHWVTIPGFYSLAVARLWHFFFAWIFVVPMLLYWTWSFANRHVQRDLAPRREELKPKHIWQDIKDHARLRFPTGAAALKYNILQKLTYLFVLFLLLPTTVLTGLTMSPTMDAAWPWLLELFGGRQSARSIHFICAFLMVGFIVVHLAMVILAGPINEIRSMITGRFRIPKKPDDETSVMQEENA